MYHSISISDRNTWDYWHLIPSSRPIVSPPEAKIQIVDVPGSTDSFIDMTEFLTGSTMYGSRQGSWQFIVHPEWCDKPSWTVRYHDIMQYLHGKNHKIILEDDPYYYYEGRLKLNGWQTGANWSTIAIDYVLKPFKKSLYEDRFSASVDGETSIIVNAGDERVVPFFDVSDVESPITMVYDETEYTLEEGTNQFKSIKLSGGGNQFTFDGEGSVIVRLRNGWL